MHDENRLRVVAEIEQRLERFLNSDEVPEARKAEVLRELLAIALEEKKV